MYPDCDNSILLANDTSRYLWAGETITEIFNVNWTKISSISWTICMPEYWKTFQWVFAYQTKYYPAICWFEVHTSWRSVLTAIDRLSTSQPIPAWLTIWKTVVLPETYIYFTWWNPTSSNTSIQLKVGILHSDWSITYIAEWTAQNYTNTWMRIEFWNLNTTNNGSLYYPQKTKQVINTVWFTTQEWDYIIAETRVEAPNSIFYLTYWTLTPESSRQRLWVFQISID